jgi:hypothetical protein
VFLNLILFNAQMPEKKVSPIPEIIAPGYVKLPPDKGVDAEMTINMNPHRWIDEKAYVVVIRIGKAHTLQENAIKLTPKQTRELAGFLTKAADYCELLQNSKAGG